MRRFSQFIILVIFVCALIEAASYAAFYLHAGESFSFSSVIARIDLQKSLQEEEARGAGQQTGNILHPYLGFVHEPSKSENPAFRVSDYGFLDDGPPLVDTNSDEVSVAVFGGSVAWWLGLHGAEEIAEAVESLPRYKGRKVRVVRVALGAYKQPQQLLAYSYLRSLGAKYDIVINLDGFNEISLPTIGLITRGINQHYPINWQLLVGTTVTPEQQAQIGELQLAKDRRRSWANLFTGFPYRCSITSLTIWSLVDRTYENSIASIRHKLSSQETAENNFPYVISGPPSLKPKQEGLYSQLASQWANSSQAMANIAKGDGTYYFHFLQPNQYVAGSKPLSPEEKEQGVADNAQYRDAVKLGYPDLQKAGSALKDAGVWFYDLSDIYSYVPATLYVDNCCHLNEQGNQLMAKRIGSEIKSRLGAIEAED